MKTRDRVPTSDVFSLSRSASRKSGRDSSREDEFPLNAETTGETDDGPGGNPGEGDQSSDPSREQPPGATNAPGASDVTYHAVRLSDLEIEVVDKKLSYLTDKQGRFERIETSARFFQALSRKANIRQDFFKLFPPAEVLERVVQKDGDRTLILAQDSAYALAVSHPDDPMIKIDEALSVMEGFGPQSLSYYKGELKAVFTPGRNSGDTDIAGETYSKRFQLTIPIDALNHPSISPLVVRQICTNGLVAETPLYTAQITIGRRDAGYTVERALRAHNGDEYFTRIAERLETSRLSWCSIAEVDQFVRLVLRSKMPPAVSARIVNQIWRLAGNAAYLMYLENQAKNPKFLRSKITTLNRYDLINMVTEARTHLIGREDIKRLFDSFAGALLARDPDLEHSVKEGGGASSPAFFFKLVG